MANVLTVNEATAHESPIAQALPLQCNSPLTQVPIVAPTAMATGGTVGYPILG